MLGGDPVIFDEDFAEMLGVDPDRFCAERRGNRRQEALDCCPTTMDEADFLVHCAVAKFIIDTFRNTNDRVVKQWYECQDALDDIIFGRETQLGAFPGVVTTGKYVVNLPNGMALRYPDLKCDEQGEYSYATMDKGRPVRAKIYGGKMTENIIQALARIVVADQKLILSREMKIVTSTHDEVVAIVPKEKALLAESRMLEVMRTPPKWAVGLPLDAEASFGRSYGDAK